MKQSLTCPSCKSLTRKVLNQYTRNINHGLFIDRKCIVHYKQKRYTCLGCLKSFVEPRSLVAKHQKKSVASHMQIMELLKDPHLTFKKVGELLNVSTNTVINTFYDTLLDYQPSLPEVWTFQSRFRSHSNKEVVKVGRSIIKWKKEILNSFTWIKGKRISNGPIESRNNIIKLLIRNAAGYRNFDHLRRPIIYCINSQKKK